MARFDRLEVLNSILDRGLLPMFDVEDAAVAQRIAAACAAGGARAVEFRNRGDGAHRTFVELARRVAQHEPDVILGAGSIFDAPTAGMYLGAGANFIVGPMFNAEIARLCNRRKVAYIPGCVTPTEISTAEESGVEICKVFPVAGPAFVKAVTGPSPWSRLMPTGGVGISAESVSSWIKAGSACLGIAADLISKDIIEGEKYELLTANVRQVLEEIRVARAG